MHNFSEFPNSISYQRWETSENPFEERMPANRAHSNANEEADEKTKWHINS